MHQFLMVEELFHVLKVNIGLIRVFHHVLITMFRQLNSDHLMEQKFLEVMR